MTSTFKYAIVFSSLIHLLALAPLYNIKLVEDDIEEKKPVVVDYIVVKELRDKDRPPLQKSTETKKSELMEKTELKQSQDNEATGKKKMKDMSQDAAKKEARIRSSRDYINYYEAIREKIRRRLKENYRDYSKEGQIHLNFTLTSEGKLIAQSVDRENSVDDETLINIAESSLRDSSPFPRFPKGLKLPTMSFSVMISFKRR